MKETPLRRKSFSNNFLTIFLLVSIVFSIVRVARAIAPNPGHSWDQTECDNNLCVDTVNGRVGVQTITPNWRLTVGSLYSGIYTGHSLLAQDRLGAYNSGGAGVSIGQTDGYSSIYAFDYSTYSARNLIINQFGGNVGIGATELGYKLHIAGANAGTDVGGLGLVGIVNTDITDGNTIGLAFGQKDTGGGLQTVASIDSIGVSHTPGAQSSALAFATRNAGVWGEKVRITPVGNVGIGATPGYKLDVQGGQMNASGGLCIDGDCKTAWSQVGGSNYRNLVTLGSDVVNSNTPANTLYDCTGLSFSVVAGTKYRFYANIWYTSAAGTTGSRWTINGPANPTSLAYSSRYSLTATTNTFNNAVAYNVPATSNATSPNTAGNMAIIEGFIVPSENGTVIVRFASEVAGSAVTCKAGSTLEWW